MPVQINPQAQRIRLADDIRALKLSGAAEYKCRQLGWTTVQHLMDALQASQQGGYENADLARLGLDEPYNDEVEVRLGQADVDKTQWAKDHLGETWTSADPAVVVAQPAVSAQRAPGGVRRAWNWLTAADVD